MHEYSITKSIIDILEKNIKSRGLGKLLKVDFEVSNISQIEPESVKFYYNILTEKKPKLKGALLNFKRKKVKVFCSHCNQTSEIDNWEMLCPNCKSKNIKLTEDDEIKIVSVEAQG